MRIASLAMFFPLALTIQACSGSDSSGDPAQPGSTGDNLADYAASWDGYAEAWQFDSGSDRVRLILDANGVGTLEVGDIPAWPAPTDPNVGYPPGAEERPQGTLVEGFAYPVYGPIVDTGRIRFGANPRDLYAGWCALQTPILDDYNTQEPVYNCLPNWGFSWSDSGCFQDNPATNEQVPVDCGKLALCNMPGVCHCNASECEIPPAVAPYAIQFDAALDQGGALVGTLVLDGASRVTVRLSRQ